MAGAWRLLALALLAAALCCGDAMFVVETGTLQVLSPQRVNFSMSVANFGNPIYGGTLRGEVLYKRDEKWGCTPFQTRFSSSGSPGTPVIALIDRGGPNDTPCSFTVKVLNAQNAGAAAVLVADNRQESLITMDAGADDTSQQMTADITIPAALVTQNSGDVLKSALALQNVVTAVMSWTDIVPRASATVSWEFWTNSNDECGVKCDIQKKLIRDFAPDATYLIQNKYTTFTPHYITLSCGSTDPDIDFCAQQCVNRGRYCQLDPDGSLSAGYSGRDIVLENLRSLCVFRTANASGTPWLWWRYSSLVGSGCSMKADAYSAACAVGIAQQLGISTSAVQDCMGDTTADAPNPVLQAERDGLSSDGRRGDIAFFPTIIANGVQYRGDMENASVLEFLCSGFSLANAPPKCLGDSVITQPCAAGRFGAQSCAARGGSDGATRCLDTVEYPYFRCACEQGATLVADASGAQRCVSTNSCARSIATVPECGCPTCVCQTMPGGAPPRCSNVTLNECANDFAGGCWKSTVGGKTVSACVPDLSAKKAAGLAGVDPSSVRGYVCTCPAGYRGDGVSKCTDIDECRDTPGLCGGAHQLCVNGVGDYKCICTGGYAMDAAGACYAITGGAKGGVGAGGVFLIVFFTLGTAAGLGYALYQWRLKQHMSNEVRSIMAQYLPMGSADEDFRPLRGDDDAPDTPERERLHSQA